MFPEPDIVGESTRTPGAPEAPRAGDEGASKPREHGGYDGPEPTRFGDWEKNGRCIDF